MDRDTRYDYTPVSDVFSNLPPGSLRVLQLTDPHLYADPSGCLIGLNTLESFDRMVEMAQMLMPLDLVLLTGDLVHDGSTRGYKRLHERLATLSAPSYCLPGNHDEPRQLGNTLSNGPVKVVASVQQADWAFIFLDSTIPNDEGGHLDDQELSTLETSLEAHTDKHTLVCLHHHPVPIGSAWMDKMALDNPERFFSILDRHPQVKGVLWGHIHQDFEAERNGVRLMGSPSTCIQFVPNQDDFGVDCLPPGYRWLALLPDGEIRSGVERLTAYPAGIDLMSAGY